MTFPASKKPATWTQEKVTEKALRWLTMRPLTAFELNSKLRKTECPAAFAVVAFQLCERLRYLDDSRTAADYAGMLRRQGYGPLRIRMGMKKRGFSAELIMRELELSAESQTEKAAELLIARESQFLREEDLYKRLNKVKSFLIRRGFSTSAASAAVRSCPRLRERGETPRSSAPWKTGRETGPDAEAAAVLLEGRRRRLESEPDPRKRREKAWRFLLSKGVSSENIRTALESFLGKTPDFENDF